MQGLPTEPIERIEMQQKGLYPMLGMLQEDSFVVIRVAQVWDESRAVRRNDVLINAGLFA